MDNVNQLFELIKKAEGFTLTIMGMGVVFLGLFSLMILLRIMRVVLHWGSGEKIPIFKKQPSAVQAERNADDPMDPQNIPIKDRENIQEEVAVAICLALHLHKLRRAARPLRIAPKDQSNWKLAQKSQTMTHL